MIFNLWIFELHKTICLLSRPHAKKSYLRLIGLANNLYLQRLASNFGAKLLKVTLLNIIWKTWQVKLWSLCGTAWWSLIPIFVPKILIIFSSISKILFWSVLIPVSLLQLSLCIIKARIVLHLILLKFDLGILFYLSELHLLLVVKKHDGFSYLVASSCSSSSMNVCWEILRWSQLYYESYSIDIKSSCSNICGHQNLQLFFLEHFVGLFSFRLRNVTRQGSELWVIQQAIENLCLVFSVDKNDTLVILFKLFWNYLDHSLDLVRIISGSYKIMCDRGWRLFVWVSNEINLVELFLWEFL